MSPSPAGSFDVCTGYSFLHHLTTWSAQEAHQCG